MKQHLQRWPHTLSYLFALWCVFVCERLYEAAYIDIPGTEEGVKLSYILTGILYDFFLSLVILGLFSVFQAIVLLLLKRRIAWLFHLLAVTAILANIALIEYFFVNEIPLDESFFFFSPEELRIIVGTGGRLTAGVVLMLAGMTAAYFLLGRLFGRWRKTSDRWNRLGHGVAVIALLCSSYVVYRNTEKPAAGYLINNKLSYFATESIAYFGSAEEQGAVKSSDFARLDPGFFSSGTVGGRYPLMHPLPAKSSLAPYFEKTSNGKAPNIVIILVESLSSDFVGKYAESTGHLMPFLDSMSQQSLYFPNMLSTCERTYNVLPAVNASVPNAPNGKMLQQMAYPDHWSLQNLLKEQYYSRFYCGVDLSFCNMAGYMNHIGTDYLVSHWDKPVPAEYDGLSNAWGYPDKDVYKQAFADQRSTAVAGKSRLDVILTISTHDPYAYPDWPSYERRVQERVKKLPESSYMRKRFTQYARQVGSFCYADDALRAFFKEAARQPEYANTIFLVTGDHGSHLCKPTEISRFKVPLLVYSPLLKAPETFNSVSTHLDIAPSLINYLRTEYLHELPRVVPFVGHELDTRPGFHADRTLSFSILQCSNEYMFSNGYALLFEGLYKVDENLAAVRIHDKKKERYFREQLRLYHLFSRYALEQDHVVRDFRKRSEAARNLRKEWKRFERQPKKEELRGEHCTLTAPVALPVPSDRMRVEIEAEVWLNDIQELTAFPTLAVSLGNIGSEKLLAYFPLRPTCASPKAKRWNRITYTLDLERNNLAKLKPENDFRAVLHNVAKQRLRIRNVKTVFYKVDS